MADKKEKQDLTVEENTAQENIEKIIDEVKKEKVDNLDAKLQMIKSKICIMKKNAKGFNYNYVDEESILLLLNELLLALNVRLIPSIVPRTLNVDSIQYKSYKDKSEKDITDALISADMIFKFKDIDSGEIEEVTWSLAGQQSDASQALGSGLTYANRYFLLKYFNVATSKDDPDKIRSEQKKKEEEEKKKEEGIILNTIQTKIKKKFAEAIQKYQSKDQVYIELGVSRNDWTKDFNNPTKQNDLLEQLENILKEQ